ncbi:MAG: phenylalanine--tRNA ligase subunit beta [Clostridiales Family XIII bacterium]|jgi:phenylalanyl-tRNA synthetase beta chain|nr:phenylalanine--tRNA ligase subunit beta [Clostridiales Family XIII bacterium]
MKVPISWLKEYVDITVPMDVFADGMILSGSNIETVETFGQDISGVVVGRVLDVKPHEDSDHLVICSVDVGAAAPLQIVTGAPNVTAGCVVPVALDGSKLPGGIKIKKGKLRGVESEGMLCSAGELGFDDKVVPMLHKDGIWLLPDEFTLGEDLVKALGLDETVIDFEITPNRPDCLSIIGMAREAAATFGGTLRYPDTACKKEDAADAAAAHIEVIINKPELCNRYTARVAKDIKIEESPWWMQRRLMFAGMRPINNIVDITNYVMLEYGHPIHAFDIRTIAGAKIVVDTAAEGEKFTTLDGQERTMSADMLLIKDAEKGSAVAGIMGGLLSEIESDTPMILVEAANFNADSIRKTSKKLGIRSEASVRFEKGVSADLCGEAADRVCALVELTGAGTVLSGVVDNYPVKAKSLTIPVRPSRMNAYLGTDLSAAEQVKILQSLEMKVEEGADGVLNVTPPHVRLDLTEEVDFTEEIARIYGYGKLATTLHPDSEPSEMPHSWYLRGVIRQILTGAGLSEIQTYSFVSPSGVDQIKLPADSPLRAFIRIINPLGEENSVMRTTLLPGMLTVLAGNANKFNAEAAAFEIGNTFRRPAEGALSDERLLLTLGCYGEGWDFFALKGVIALLLARLGISGAEYTAVSDADTYHPGRCAALSVAGRDGGRKDIGLFGEIHPDVADTFGLDTRVVAAELALETLIAEADLARDYTHLDKYPAVTRDISLLADEAVTVGTIEKIVTEGGGALLESVKLFDVYRGKQIPEGKKSLAFSLVYRAPDRTLTDEEVASVHEKIVARLAADTGAALREM